MERDNAAEYWWNRFGKSITYQELVDKTNEVDASKFVREYEKNDFFNEPEKNEELLKSLST